MGLTYTALVSVYHLLDHVTRGKALPFTGRRGITAPMGKERSVYTRHQKDPELSNLTSEFDGPHTVVPVSLLSRKALLNTPRLVIGVKQVLCTRSAEGAAPRDFRDTSW